MRHVFHYWSYNGEEYDFSKPVNGDIRLVADWEYVKCTVTFDYGSNTSVRIVNYGSTVDPDSPWVEHIKWYLGDSKYDFSTPVTENITLTAKWE